MEIYYSMPTKGERYRCGACPYMTADIKTLHFHVKQHTQEGSFFYCNQSKTAFPKYNPKHASTQTELLVEITSDDIIRTGNSLRFIPEVDTSFHKTLEQDKTKVEAQRIVEDTDDLLTDDFNGAMEEVTDYPEIESNEEPKSDENPLVEIPLSYKYKSNEELLHIFLNENPEVVGQKKGKNNYLVIASIGSKGVAMFDDGVCWNGSTRNSTKQHFSIDASFNLSKVYKKESKYCIKRFHKRRCQYEILQPQPDSVIVFHKIIVSLQGNESYKRRITSILEAPDNLAFLTSKSVVEYYMDITSVQKASGGNNQLNVTLPDCTKLKEILYPGVSHDIPEQSGQVASNSIFHSEGLEGTDFDDSTDYAETKVFGNTEDNVNEVLKAPTATGYQYMKDDELLQVILKDNVRKDETKNYRVFISNSNGFQKVDEYGIWTVSSTTSLKYIVSEENTFSQVTKKDDKYCLVNRKPGGSINYEELSVEPKDLLILQKCTFKLSISDLFKKRETVVWSVPNQLAHLRNKHLVEYCREKSDDPLIEQDEDGKTKLVVQKHTLHPVGGAFQSELSTLMRAGVFANETCFLQVAKSGCPYMSNEEILEKMIVDGTDSKSTDDQGRNYMVIRNEKANGKSNVFLRDGCVWNAKSGTSVNQMFAIDESNSLRGVMIRDGKYCMKKRIDNKNTYAPLDPQPEEIITFHKYFTTLKSCRLYKKRVTSVIAAPERLEFLKFKVLVEYYMDKTDMTERFKKFVNRKSSTLSGITGQMVEYGNQSVKRKFDEMELNSVPDTLNINDSNRFAYLNTGDQNDSFIGDIEPQVGSVDIQLPVTNMFMTCQEIWRVLTIEGPVTSVLSCSHHKDYIVVSSEDTDGINSLACQDGLAWDGTTFCNVNQSFIIEAGKLGKLVMERKGLYCSYKQVNRQVVYQPIKPQPKEVVSFHRVWIRLKNKPLYKKRITTVTDVPDKYAFVKSRVLIEYSINKARSKKSKQKLDTVQKLNMKKANLTTKQGKSYKLSKQKKITKHRDMSVEETSSITDSSVVDDDDDNDGSGSGECDTAEEMEKSVYSKEYTSPSVNRTYKSKRLQEQNFKQLRVSLTDLFGKKSQKSPSTQQIQRPQSSHVLTGTLMSLDSVVDTLLTEETVTSIKERPLDKNYAIIATEWDAADRKRLLHDGMKWDCRTGTTVNQKYSVTADNKFIYIVNRDGSYCAKKKDQGRVYYEVLSPQPTDIVTLHRYWVKGKDRHALSKRVTAAIEVPERLGFLKSRVLVEYAEKV